MTKLNYWCVITKSLQLLIGLIWTLFRIENQICIITRLSYYKVPIKFQKFFMILLYLMIVCFLLMIVHKMRWHIRFWKLPKTCNMQRNMQWYYYFNIVSWNYHSSHYSLEFTFKFCEFDQFKVIARFGVSRNFCQTESNFFLCHSQIKLH